MPKASFDTADMYSPSGRGFVETIGTKKSGEITAAVFRYTQFSANKKTGEQLAPLTAFILSIAEIDKDGVQIAPPVETEMVVEFGPRADSGGGMIKIRPGLADTATDDAADTVDENGNLVLGTEGNVVFVEEGTRINMKLPFGIFMDSCKQHGFKPQILQNGFAPDFVGTRAVFTLAIDAGGKKKKDGSDITNLVVDSFIRFPYEQQAAAPKAAVKKTAAPKAAASAPAAPAQKTNGTVATPAAPAAAPAAGGDDIEAICISALQKVSAKAAADGNDTLTRQKIIVLAIQTILAPGSGVDKSKHQAIQARLKDQVWFEENAIAFGAVNSGDDKWMLVGA